jgi:hypothetical protein
VEVDESETEGSPLGRGSSTVSGVDIVLKLDKADVSCRFKMATSWAYVPLCRDCRRRDVSGTALWSKHKASLPCRETCVLLLSHACRNRFQLPWRRAQPLAAVD